MLATMGVTWFLSRNHALQEMEHTSQVVADNFADDFASNLDIAASIPNMVALDIADGFTTSPEKVDEYLRGIVTSHPRLFGVAIAWLPKKFKSGDNGFAPYVYRGPDGLKLVQLNDPKFNYQQKPWFSGPVKDGSPLWTEPHLDDVGSGTLVMTYAIPFKVKNVVAGVVCADLSLASVQRQCNTLGQANQGLAFVTDQSGRFLACPDASLIMQKSLADVAPSLAQQIARNSDEGLAVASDPFTRRGKTWFFYKHLPKANLTFVLGSPEHTVLSDLRFLETSLLVSTLVYNLVILSLVSMIARSVTRPIEDLLRAAKRVSRGELNVTMPAINVSDETGALPYAFNRMISDVNRHMQELQQTTAERERFDRELQIASEIHSAMLPHDFPLFPDRTDFDVYGRCMTGLDIGGDFYDCFFIDDDHLAVCVADTSGKGVAAAVSTAVCRALLRACAFSASAPSRVLEEVNRRFCDDSATPTFATAVFAVLDTRSGQLVIANAGHPAPYLVAADGRLTAVGPQRNSALGAVRKASYEEETMLLNPGDQLFLFTDGVQRAENVKQQRFGNERLRRVLEAGEHETPQALGDAVLGEIEEFLRGAPQPDDLTLMVLQFKAARAAQTPTEHLAIDNSISEMPKIVEWVETIAPRFNADREAELAMQLGLEELLANTITYGYDTEGGHAIELRAWVADGTWWVEVQDDAKPFNPTGATSSGGPGGWGLTIVQQMMDEFAYRRWDKKNVVVLGKKLMPPEPEEGSPAAPAAAGEAEDDGATAGPVLVQRLADRIDVNSSAELDRALREASANGEKRILLDLSNVEYLSSAGLRVLVAARQRADREGGALALAAPQAHVREVLTVAGLLPLFTIHDSVAQARKVMEGPS
jgi:sigma-B regulation protein RsbU (phosphoserine phosphatase)